MPLKMKQLPKSERPYEKLLMYGAKKLSNAELLAIIIKTGTKEETAIDIANRILLLSENISGLANISIETLEKIKGIGKVKAIQIKAVCELATRINSPINKINTQIFRPSDVAKMFMQELKHEKREILKLILLNTKNEVVKNIELKIGSIRDISITSTEVLKEVIKEELDRFIVVHNHPSGDSTPSQKDIDFTKRLEECSKLLKIDFLDHIVIGKDKYTSIKRYLEKNNNVKNNLEKNLNNQLKKL